MSRARSRASSPSNSSAASVAPNAALLGAATAFARPVPHKRASSRSYAGSNGSQRAADGVTKSPFSSSQGIASGSAADHGASRAGVGDATRLAEPRPGRGHFRSPSYHAASVAAARAPSSAMRGRSPTDTTSRPPLAKRPSAPPKPKRLSAQSVPTVGDGGEQPTDATPIPSTTSLVNLFERQASVQMATSSKRPPPDPIVIAASPDLTISSPKPVRSSGAITTMLQIGLDGAKDKGQEEVIPARVRSPLEGDQAVARVITPSKETEPSVWDPNTRSLRPQSEVRQFEKEMSAADKVDERRHSAASRSSPGRSPTTASNGWRSSSALLKPVPSDPVRVKRGSMSSTHDGAGSHSPASGRSPTSVSGQFHQLYGRRLTPNMTGDQLANAMIASSLASSRAPSPRPPSKLEPPPPPTRRQKHKLSFSREPSPTKTGMLHTLRKASSVSSGSDDDMHPYSKHKKDKHRLVRKHPNKHHEGDRKRWREAVTERERKRYEGVWAANRGLHCTLTPEEQRFVRRAPDSVPARELQGALADQVSNLAAREIWARSRLPDPTLEMVWDLVDSDGVGRLSREEFVVGLWLIDQRLKGRKLPIRVSDSVWASVRSLHGIKIRKSIHR